MISVKILADSINPAGVRLTSWLLTYPRFIHSEFMTHRIFSRNAASSRAIPFKKMLRDIDEHPAIPERFGAEQKGMQSGEELTGSTYVRARDEWVFALGHAITSARIANDLGLHKSLCNRLIEPWSHITVLATATDHRNFFALRAHPDAMPEFQVLAYRMLDQYIKNQPEKLEWGSWHIPNFDPKRKLLQIANPGDLTFVKIASARCARLSYLTFEGDHSPEKDIELHDRLLVSGHMSPFEHCAQAISVEEDRLGMFTAYPWSNFDTFNRMEIKASGWGQYRKLFEQENRTEVDLDHILATKPDWITL